MVQIQPKANDLIRQHQGDAPVDPAKIARNLGINVWESNKLPEGISGKLFNDPINGGIATGFSIVVNKTDSYVRKRFTIAHEIAHFLLHRDRIKDGELLDDVWYRSGLSSTEEGEANRLAADILMPEHLIRRYAQFSNNTTALAKIFEVSPAAMRIQMDALARRREQDGDAHIRQEILSRPVA